MHAGRRYTLKEFLLWTRRTIYMLIPMGIIPVLMYEELGWKWIAVPWVPVALIGTAAAFIAGFRNNATYARTWEARQIWGSIVNSSRTWGIMVKDYVRMATDKDDQRVRYQLIYRHMAWLTALRFQLRESKKWENIKTKSYNREYMAFYPIAEWNTALAEELKAFMAEEERNYVLTKKNRATQIISLQSKQLKELNKSGALDTLCYVEMENLLKDLYTDQGKSERIKNFPYPRQFATINLFFIRLLAVLLPFGMLNEFAKLGPHMVWLTVPFSVIVGWVFMSLEQVGESTENPFEGGSNDVPITSMCRTIEIDLRDMLDEQELPPPILPVNDILT